MIVALLPFIPLIKARLKKKGHTPKKNIKELALQAYYVLIKNVDDKNKVDELINASLSKRKSSGKKGVFGVKKKKGKRRKNFEDYIDEYFDSKEEYFEFLDNEDWIYFEDYSSISPEYSEYYNKEYELFEIEDFDEDFELEQENLENVEPVTISVAISSIIDAFKNLVGAIKKKKEKGEKLTPTEEKILEVSNQTTESVKENVKTEIGREIFRYLPFIVIGTLAIIIVVYVYKSE